MNGSFSINFTTRSSICSLDGLRLERMPDFRVALRSLWPEGFRLI
jgi:hypothetical protein